MTKMLILKLSKNYQIVEFIIKIFKKVALYYKICYFLRKLNTFAFRFPD